MLGDRHWPDQRVLAVGRNDMASNSSVLLIFVQQIHVGCYVGNVFIAFDQDQSICKEHLIQRWL